MCGVPSKTMTAIRERPTARRARDDGHEQGNGRPATGPRRSRRYSSYRRVVVCLSPAAASAEACGVACMLAAERGALITAIAAIEVPLEVPLQTVDAAAESAARAAVYTAHAVADTYGISLDGVVLRAHGAGEAIVAEVEARRAQLVIVPAGSAARSGAGAARLPVTAAHVLKHVTCRVMLIARPNETQGAEHAEEFDTVFHSGRPRDYWPTGEFVDRDERDASRRSNGNPLPAP
jgi:hypothetical protein